MLFVAGDPAENLVGDLGDQLAPAGANRRACAMRRLGAVRITRDELLREANLLRIAVLDLEPVDALVPLDDVDRVPVGKGGHDDGTQVAEHAVPVQVRQEHLAGAEEELLRRLQAPLVADVAQISGERWRARNWNPRDRQLARKGRTVGAHPLHLDAPAEDRTLPRLEVPCKAAIVRVAVPRRDDGLRELSAEDLGALVPEGALGGGIPLEDPSLMIDRDDAIECDLHDSSVANTLTESGLVCAPALDEDAELEPEAEGGIEHMLIGRLDVLAVELDDADDLRGLLSRPSGRGAVGDAEDGERERPVQSLASRDLLAGKAVDVADVFHPHRLACLPDYTGHASAARKGPSARRRLELGVAPRSPDGRAPQLLNRVVEQPECAKLPTELCTQLVQGTAESVLDGVGF